MPQRCSFEFYQKKAILYRFLIKGIESLGGRLPHLKNLIDLARILTVRANPAKILLNFRLAALSQVAFCDQVGLKILYL